MYMYIYTYEYINGGCCIAGARAGNVYGSPDIYIHIHIHVCIHINMYV